ncbi:MAG: rod shape-determining protein MreD [Gemmatimonadales bacterium]
MRRGPRYGFLGVVVVLVVLHFTVRPRMGDDRLAPDFLLLALLLYGIRSQPGRSAAAGFVVGLLRDALAPASFGAGALAHTLVGYLCAWGKVVFFAEHLLVSGWLLFAGTWLRNLIVTLASGQLEGAALWWELGYYSTVQSVTTAAVGVGLLWPLGRWLAFRPGDA